MKGPCILFNVTRMETIVCTPALSAGVGGGGLNLQPNFKKGGSLTGPQLLEGVAWKEAVTFFRGGGALFTKKEFSYF